MNMTLIAKNMLRKSISFSFTNCFFFSINIYFYLWVGLSIVLINQINMWQINKHQIKAERSKVFSICVTDLSSNTLNILNLITVSCSFVSFFEEKGNLCHGYLFNTYFTLKKWIEFYWCVSTSLVLMIEWKFTFIVFW